METQAFLPFHVLQVVKSLHPFIYLKPEKDKTERSKADYTARNISYIQYTTITTHKYVRCTVRDSRICQKCLEVASTLKYEPLNSCITVHRVWIMKIFNVMLLNTCSRNERWKKNCEESTFIWRSQSALVLPLTMPCLIDANISLVPEHPTQSTFNLISSCKKHPNIQSHKDTYAHTTDIWAIFFKIAQKL